MPTAELLALLLLGAAMSFTPGPNTTLAAALAANRGLRAAMAFVCAVPVGWGMLLLISSLGVGALVQAWPAARWALKIAGLGLLLWLALQLWRAGGTLREARELEIGFSQGVLLQFVNIKAWTLAFMVSAGWLSTQGQWAQRIAVVLPVMMAFALASNLAYALLGAALRGWLAGGPHPGQRLRVFNRVLALVLAGTALWMLTL
ncbi:MAG: LysE family translocator [Rubrivivax sp.]|jgi:threonine/homoserine/homoserine lactone efflux protein|nr:LysE family transporter [Rubrivivax sp.]